MKTVTTTHFKRLIAQAEEARLLGLTKIAESIDSLVVDTRDDKGIHIYASKELEKDVNDALWDAAVRVSDYLGASPDAKAIQAEIDRYAADFIRTMCVLANVKDGVGAYEPTVPGEHREVVALEVSDG